MLKRNYYRFRGKYPSTEDINKISSQILKGNFEPYKEQYRKLNSNMRKQFKSNVITFVKDFQNNFNEKSKQKGSASKVLSKEFVNNAVKNALTNIENNNFEIDIDNKGNNELLDELNEAEPGLELTQINKKSDEEPTDEKLTDNEPTDEELTDDEKPPTKGGLSKKIVKSLKKKLRKNKKTIRFK